MSVQIRSLSVAFLCFVCLRAYAGVAVVEGVPAGFEQLETPQPSVVSLYYGGDYIGAFPVHITPQTVLFDHPAALLETIPALKEKDTLLQALRQPLPVHAELICRPRQTEGCGVLNPDPVGIIFNEATLNGEFFINKNYLSVVDSRARYLPLPPEHLSSIYAFNGAVNGTSEEDPNFALSNNSIFAFGEKKLVTQSTASDRGLRFDTAKLSVERNGWDKSAGLLRSYSSQLIGDVDMAGVSIGTSSNTVVDSEKTRGNNVLVYLARRSFVSIYREERLYSSRTYEAGNQVIDTSELPDGAYTITLRIQEVNGAMREEKRFFVKNEEIPPAGYPVYYSQLGFVRQPNNVENSIPELTDKPLLRLGTRRRVGDNMGIGLGVTGIEDRAAGEAGTFWMTPRTKTQANVMASSRGDAGYNINYIFTDVKFNAAIDMRQVFSSDAPDTAYQNIFSDYRQVSGTFAYSPTYTVNVGLRGSYADQKGSPASSSIGPYAQWRVWQKGESMLQATADVARTQDGTTGSVLLQLTHRFGDYGVTATGGQNVGKNSGIVAGTRVWHQKDDGDNRLLVGAGVNKDADTNTVSADADWRNNFGQVQGSVQHSTGDTSTTGYGGNLAFNAALLDRKLRIGGNQMDSSAVIIRASGNARTSMRIFVNGSERGQVKVGEEQAIYLSPFHTYKVTVGPAGPGFFDYDANYKKITLYPGNVVAMDWTITTFRVVVATIIHPDGTPVVNALLQKSRARIATGENGELQAEISEPHMLDFVGQDSSTCRVELPSNVRDANGVLLYPEPLVCNPIAQNSFSEEVAPSQTE